MGRTLVIALIAALCAMVAAAPGSAQERVALVIANADYEYVPSLDNPVNDAADIAEALERLGFDVELVHDLGFGDMREELQRLRSRVSGADIAVVYYAGHGIEVDRQNYLIPVDAALRTDGDVDFEAVPLDLVMRAVQGARNLRLVIVDACRDNPFASSMQVTDRSRSIGRGLARVEPSGNTLVAFAAKEGTTAADGDDRNSPYAAALLRHIEEPGLEIGLLFRRVRDSVLESTGNEQEPFLYGSLSSASIYLMDPVAEPEPEPEPGPAVVQPAPAPGSFDATGIEITFWTSVKDTGDPTMLRLYLQRYPDGAFAELARAMIERLEAPSGEPVIASVDPAPTVAPTRGAAAALARDHSVRVTVGDFEIGGERRSAIGVQVARIEAPMARSLGLDGSTGTAVISVNAGGPAEVAGIRPGDVITDFDGEAIRDIPDLPRLSGELASGAVVAVGITRYGDSLDDLVRTLEGAADRGDNDAGWTLYHLYKNAYGGLDDGFAERRWTRTAADAGDAEAQYAMSVAYQEGDGVAEDESEALRWARLAANQGHAAAMGYVGLAYEYGNGVGQDMYEALRWFRKGAEAGDSYSQYSMGWAHAHEQAGLKKDFFEAVRWYRMAADQGRADAQYQISIAYQYGEGVSQSDAEALVWARKSAAQDHSTALAYVGHAYEQGLGVASDPTEALNWYQRAADLEHSFAEYAIGRYHEFGIDGVAADITEAVRWYRRAGEHGDPDAQAKVGDAYMWGNGVPEDEPESIRWYRMAVEQDNAAGQRGLGFAYMYGYGVTQDQEEAVRWYRLGADGGDAEAQRRLGFAYSAGEGIAKDDIEALDWWRRAADQGDTIAEAQVGWAYRTGTGVAIDHYEAATWLRIAADKGNLPAMYNLGAAYDDGDGVTVDRQESARLLYETVRRGNDFALEQMKTNEGAWSLEFRENLQRLLRDGGYYSGSIDGQFGPATDQALDLLYNSA